MTEEIPKQRLNGVNVGDTVWDLFAGEATVLEIELSNPTLPMRVQFKRDGSKECYYGVDGTKQGGRGKPGMLFKNKPLVPWM